MVKLHGKKSKRVTTRKRTKIERKVREHNRKLKKDSKKSGKRKVKRKDPGIPNSCPFKEDVLKEAEDRKIRLEEERQKQKDKARKERDRMLAKKRNLGDLMKDAQKRTADFDRRKAFVQEHSKDYTGGKSVETSLKAYYKEFKKVIEAADVILQVLDARDPLGSRCKQVEEAVLSAGTDKKLVLLLNKIDLVPKENVEKWLKYLRNEFPTLAFKASTQTQADNLSQSRVSIENASDDLLKSSRCLGADMLMKLLGNYCRNQDIRTSIRVGIVGFPNTGKSSIINSLKRSKACNVGATPGVTKSMQEVQLDKHIKLLDSPGIVMATGNTDAATILRNCVKVESIDDPTTPVAAILRRCNKQHIMMHYNVPDFSDVHEFLALLAKRFGRLKKGGVPDVNKAARGVLQDWNHGKITYYTHPPESHTMSTHMSAQIVTEMSKAFDIESLLKDEEITLKDLKTASSSDMVIDSLGPAEVVLDEEDVEEKEEEDMEEEEEEEEEQELSSVTVPVSKKGSGKEKTEKKPKKDAESVLKGNMQINKSRKKEVKKMKKQRRRADAVAGSLSSALEDAFAGLGGGKTGSEDYNFDVDFK